MGLVGLKELRLWYQGIDHRLLLLERCLGFVSEVWPLSVLEHNFSSCSCRWFLKGLVLCLISLSPPVAHGT